MPMRTSPFAPTCALAALLAACNPSDSDGTTGSGGETSGTDASTGSATGSGDTAATGTSAASTTDGATTGSTTDSGGGGAGFCAPRCQSVADCLGPMPTPTPDEDNYACEAGACRYLGCKDTSECPDGGGVVSFVCAAQAADQVPVCALACTTPADCALSPMDSPDNYECIDGGCFTKPCTEADVCTNGLVCAPDLWIGDDVATPGCTYPCTTVDDCSALASVGHPLACDGGLCVYETCGSDADCPDPNASTCVFP